jgi:RimJ/RimL family protein N-acetyltransferase
MNTLETDRLRLRMPRESDIDAYADMCGDPEVMRHIGDGQPLARPVAWRNLAMTLGHWALRGYGLWAVEERATGAFVGRIGFWNPEGWPGFELGWTLRSSFWGKGYATEGARAALRFAFTQLNRSHVVSLIHPDNAASMRVAERLGERRGDVIDVTGRPVVVYRITREEWEAGGGGVSQPPSSAVFNHLGQPVGVPLPGWAPPPAPAREPMVGRYCRLEPLDPDRHAAALFAAHSADADGRSWTYLAYGPFESLESYTAWMKASCLGDDPLFFAVIDSATERPVGVASYLRITPASGTVEVGHLHYSPGLKRSRVSTEAMHLMMERAFAQGYRRYEWKCDTLNAASRAAAERLGFSFEGIFRQATVYKGRNRDTAWYAVIDADWPALRAAFLAWLDPTNFDADGQQRTQLSDLTRPLLRSLG